MLTEVQTRVMSVFGTRVGVLVPNPVLEASVMWGPAGDTTALRAWLVDPVTVRVLGLIKELAVNPPSGLVGVDKIENYGLTSGLQLAARVMEDPTMLFPQVYDGPGPTARPEPDYETEAGA